MDLGLRTYQGALYLGPLESKTLAESEFEKGIQNLLNEVV